MLGEVITPTHLIFVTIAALLIFGPKRVPYIGRSLGKGIKEFRGGLLGDDRSKADMKAKSPSGESARLT